MRRPPYRPDYSGGRGLHHGKAPISVMANLIFQPEKLAHEA